nr:MAG TPA: hypothetical protein [Caudoviricetes sp.]DAX34767.1 MAG TPA: hypothetical protein [Caudoviricetes sp.]
MNKLLLGTSGMMGFHHTTFSYKKRRYTKRYIFFLLFFKFFNIIIDTS